jgi:hypothetical protein
MSNDAAALRDLLFDTIRGVKDGTLELDQAKAISEGAQTIINLAKAEIDMLKVVGPRRMSHSGFLGAPAEDTLDKQTRVLEHAPQAKPGNGLPPRGPQATL